MATNILERLEIIRNDAKLSKGDFEKVIDKSSGYINALSKKNGIPSADVIVKVVENFDKYDAEWILTGKGDKFKNIFGNQIIDKASENPSSYSKPDIGRFIVDSENRIRKDLATMTEGMTHNFEVISKGIMRGLQDQQKILKFIDELDVKRINEATGKLEVFLNQ